MKLKFSFLENTINLNDEYIMCLEVENKKYFYRIIDILIKYSEGIFIEDNLFDTNFNIRVIIDYFNLELNNRKTLNNINKIIISNLTPEYLVDITNLYKKFLKNYEKILKEIDIPLTVNKDFQLENISKIFDLKIHTENDVLKDLLILIDTYKETKEYNMIFLINLKQYLTEDELQELYKYSIYNKVKIVLIDSQSYGIAKKYEKKLIIDDNLEEEI